MAAAYTVFRQGGERLVNSGTLGDQSSPVATGLQGGRSVVVWYDQGTFHLRGQLLGPDGTRIGSEFSVDDAAFDQPLSIAAVADGGFIVSWLDGSGPRDLVKGRFFDASGSTVGAAFTVKDTDVSLTATNSAVAYLPNDLAVVAYDEINIDTTTQSVKAQVIFRGGFQPGTKYGPEIVVATPTSGPQYDPAVTALKNSTFVVAWSDAGGGSSGDVRAQVFSFDGQPVTEAVVVNTTLAGTQSAATVAGLSDNRFVVAWQDASHLGGDSSGTSIKLQLFAADGTKSGGEILVNAGKAGDQLNPEVRALANGGFIVSWTDNGPNAGDASGSAVRAQSFDASGIKVGSEILINTNTQGNQASPTIAPLSTGDVLVSWVDASGTGDDISGTSIKTQLFGVSLQNKVWTGTTDGDWHNGANWSPLGEPTLLDDVAIASGGVTAYAGAVYAHSIRNDDYLSLTGDTDGYGVYGKIAGDVLNNGELDVDFGSFAGGSVVSIGGALTNTESGRFFLGNYGGPTTVTATAMTNAGVFSIFSVGGYVIEMQVAGELENSGSIYLAAPAISAGSYVGERSGSLQLSIASEDPTYAARIAVTDDATLRGGRVNVGFDLSLGDKLGAATLPIMTFATGQLYGMFDTLAFLGVAQPGNGTTVDKGEGQIVGLLYNDHAGHIDMIVTDAPASTADRSVLNGSWMSAATWNSGLPTFYSDVTIATVVTLGSDATVDSLVVSSGSLTTESTASLFIGSSVTVEAGKILTVGGKLYEAGAVQNDGTIAVQGGTVGLHGSVAGLGTITLTASSTVELYGAVSSGQTVAFLGASNDRLSLLDANLFHATLAGFAAGDVIDLLDTPVDDLTVTGGHVLTARFAGTVVATIELAGDYSGYAFAHTSDGEGGTLITTRAPGGATEGDDRLTGTPHGDMLNGLGGNDLLSGLAGADTLIGGSGNDTLNGGADTDDMRGGEGDDYYIVDTTSDMVRELPGGGIRDTVQASVSLTLVANVERLILLEGSGDLSGVGNGLDNYLLGNSGKNLLSGGAGHDVLDGQAGDDTLNGGAGPDEMAGGRGDDLYVVDDRDDVVSERPGEGERDVVNASMTYALTPNVERLALTGLSNIGGTGNELDNYIYGNAANNLLKGLAGNDIIDGGGGEDRLEGGADGDTLAGGAGNDTLTGGAGDDNLYGGAGTDTFVFTNGWGNDRVFDFANDGQEKLDFTQVAGVHSIVDLIIAQHIGYSSVSVGHGDEIRLFGIAASHLSGTDFLFA